MQSDASRGTISRSGAVQSDAVRGSTSRTGGAQAGSTRDAGRVGSNDRVIRDSRTASGNGRQGIGNGARGSTLGDRPVIGDDRRSTYGNDRRVIGNRSTLSRPDWRPNYHSARWDRNVWYPRYWWRPPVRVYSPSYLRIHWPRIHVQIDWPWLVRYERDWAPVYRYRQTYRIEAGYGDRRDWTNVQVETVYSHQVRYADGDRASIEVRIDRIEIYDGDRFLGYVDRLPENMSRIDATVYRNGEVEFDQDIFLLGDPYVGFEVIATRPYDGWVMDDYRADDGYRAGSVDLGRNRVDPIRRSRFFDPESYSPMVPISLLPDRDGWLWDYGSEALSARVDDYDYYYGSGSARGAAPAYDSEPLTQEDSWSFDTRLGSELQFNRQSTIQRVR